MDGAADGVMGIVFGSIIVMVAAYLWAVAIYDALKGKKK